MSPPSTVTIHLVRNIVAAASVLGADSVELNAAVGLTPELLSDPEARIPLDMFTALFEEAARRTGDETFGLHAAELARRQLNNPLALALHSSPTLGEALRRAARYIHLVNTTLEIRLDVEGAASRLSHRQHAPNRPSRHGVECSLAMLFLFGRRAIGPAFRLQKVCFRHPQPKSAAEHARLFEAPVEFGGALNALVFESSCLTIRIPTASERICRHIDRLLDEMVSELPRRPGIAEQVRSTLAADLRDGPTLDRVAMRLGMPARSLQRRLEAEGASYNDLLDELRRELSQRYLREPDLALAEVAFLLGFAEQSAFQRAFKRWTGDTPAQWRRQVIAARAGTCSPDHPGPPSPRRPRP